MKRNCRIRIYLSSEELEGIKIKADKCGMTIQSYVRFLALKAEPRVERVKI